MKPEGYVHGMTDKPAATVHGTGSGEAKCTCVSTLGDNPNCIRHFGTPQRPEYIAMGRETSPTVTLDRETFEKAKLRLTHLRHLLSPTAHIDGGKFDLAVEVLALLLAGERQK